MVEGAAGEGLAGGALAPRVGRTVTEVRRVGAELAERGAVVAVGERLVAAAPVAAAREALLAMVGAYHEAHPLEPGLPREEARERLAKRGRSGVVRFTSPVPWRPRASWAPDVI